MQKKPGKEGGQHPRKERPKRKHVGDRTPNPLPDDDYALTQPPGDDNEADPNS